MNALTRRVPSSSPTRARWRLAGAALLVGAVLAGCTLPAPPGAAPLRYRDVMFSATQHDGLVYGSAPDASGTVQNLTLDMYTPAGDTQTRRPAIVLVHGGGFRGGNSKDTGMVELANAFADRGYVAVSINYPLLAGTDICSKDNPPTQTCINAAYAAQHATQAAIRWLRANATTYGVDPSRIAVEGASAGAVTALAVAVNSADPGTDGTPDQSSYAQAAMAISGELPHSDADLFKPSDSPVLMFNGTADQTVPFSAGVQTAGDLYNTGALVVFEALQGAGHVPFSTDGTLMIDQSVYFAYDVLDLADAAGQPASAAAAERRQEAQMARSNPRFAAALRRRLR